jgi:predicted DNA-binding transcriptional regulator AlpA
MNIQNLIENGANISVSVSPIDLKEFGLSLIDEAKKKAEKETETFLTARECAKMCGVTLNSLWRWEKSGYLVPRRVGRKVFYAKSDVNNLLSYKS